jgi:hypothetical protein
MEPVIRSLRHADLKEADTIFRLSFGKFLGLLDPMSFSGDADYIGTRFRADPSLSLAVEVDGTFVGSNFMQIGVVLEYLDHSRSILIFGTRVLQNVC